MPRLIIGWILLAFAVLFGIVGGVISFFGAALFTSNVLVMVAAGLAVCFGLSSVLAWLTARSIFPAQRTRIPWTVGLGTMLLTALLAAVTIFLPLGPSAEPMAASPQTSYWDLPTGSRIAYLHIPAQGVARATPIIRVHGGPGAFAVANQRSVEYIGQLAREGYDVYFYDQVGGGYSSRLADPRGYTITRHVEDLEAIRIQMGAERVILFGESWGGTLVANYMAAHPEHVAKAIFSSPGPINPAEWKESQNLAPERAAEMPRQSSSLMNHPRFMALVVLLNLNPQAARALVPDPELDGRMDALASVTWPALACNSTVIPEAPSGFSFWANMMVQNSFKQLTANPRARLASNPTPVLILRGECDHIKWEVTHEYKATLPNSTLIYFPRAGHVIYWEQPELYLEAVRAFLLDRPFPLPSYRGDLSPK